MLSRNRRKAIVDASLDHAASILEFAESALELAPLPGLSLIAKGLKALVERVQTARVNDEARKEFLDKAVQLIRLLGEMIKKIKDVENEYSNGAGSSTLPAPVNSPELQTRLEALSDAIVEIRERTVKFKGGEGFLGACKGISFAGRNKKVFADMDKALADALNIFRFCGEVSIETIVNDLILNTKVIRKQIEEAAEARKEAEQQRIIDSIRHAAAGYRSVADLKSEFMEGTREQTFKELMLWTAGAFPEGEPKQVYWLSGGPGVGKSSIAYQLCKILDAEEPSTLGASFFFVRGSGDLASSRLFSPTLAHQIALSQPHLRSYIADAIRHHSKRGTNQLTEYAFDDLLRAPLVQAPAPSQRQIVLVIDGLDECQDREAVPGIIKSLLDLTAEIPWLRVFVASRPDIHIASVLANNPAVYHRDMNNTVEESVHDVARYLRETIPKIRGYDSYTRENPESLSKLVEHAGGLFIYARVVVKFLETFHDHPEEQFKLLLDSDSVRNRCRPGESALDALYMQVLKSAFPPNELEQATPARQKRLQIILGVIALWTNILQNGVPPVVVAAFYRQDLSLNDVINLFDRLRSLLRIGREGRVFLIHASIQEFLVDSARCSIPLYHVSQSKWAARFLCRIYHLQTFDGWNDICNAIQSHQSTAPERLYLYLAREICRISQNWGKILWLDANDIPKMINMFQGPLAEPSYGRFWVEHGDSLEEVLLIQRHRYLELHMIWKSFVEKLPVEVRELYSEALSAAAAALKRQHSFVEYSALWWQAKGMAKDKEPVMDILISTTMKFRRFGGRWPMILVDLTRRKEFEEYHTKHENLARKIKDNGLETFWYLRPPEQEVRNVSSPEYDRLMEEVVRTARLGSRARRASA